MLLITDTLGMLSVTGQYDQIQSPMRWDLITKKLLLMFIMGLVFFILTLICEYMSRIRAR